MKNNKQKEDILARLGKKLGRSLNQRSGRPGSPDLSVFIAIPIIALSVGIIGVIAFYFIAPEDLPSSLFDLISVLVIFFGSISYTGLFIWFAFYIYFVFVRKAVVEVLESMGLRWVAETGVFSIVINLFFIFLIILIGAMFFGIVFENLTSRFF